MLDNIYGLVYTIVYVILCKMYMEIFVKKRAGLLKRHSILLLIGLIGGDYLLSSLLENHLLIKMITIIFLNAVVMCLYFEQRFVRIGTLVLLYQGLGLVVDYISMITIGRAFADIKDGVLENPMLNMYMGTLSQIVLFFIILQIRRYYSRNSAEMLTAME